MLVGAASSEGSIGAGGPISKMVLSMARKEVPLQVASLWGLSDVLRARWLASPRVGNRGGLGGVCRALMCCFAESFTFLLGLKGLLAKRHHSSHK